MLTVRRKRNILGLMYQFSQKPNNTVTAPRVLRGDDKVRLKVQRPKGQLYCNSPLYRGLLPGQSYLVSNKRLPQKRSL